MTGMLLVGAVDRVFKNEKVEGAREFILIFFSNKKFFLNFFLNKTI